MNTKSIRRLLTSLSFIICHLAFSVALTSCDEIVSHFASPDDLDFVSDVKTDKVSGNYVWASYGGKTGWVDKRFIEYC